MTELSLDEKERTVDELIPSEGDKDVGNKVMELVAEVIADKMRIGLHDRWIRNHELDRNKHWRYDSKKVPLISANLCHVHKQRTVNHLTDNNPTFNVRAAGAIPEDDKDTLNRLHRTVTNWWNETEQQDVLESSIENGEVYGSAIEKVVFNPDLEFGMGEVEALTIDPFHFGFYPVKCKQLQKCEAVFHFYPMTVRGTRRKWSHVQEQIKSDDEILKELGDERREIGSTAGRSASKNLLVSIGGVIKNLLGYSDQATDTDPELLIVECWVKDYSETEEVETQKTGQIDEHGMPVQVQVKVTKPKYFGHIRCITSCSSVDASGNHLVLDDRNNPNINPNLPIEQAQITYLFDKFPFTHAVSLKDTATAWGVSSFEQLEALNIELDKSLSQFNLMKDKSARPKLINPKTSGVRNDELTTYPGIINPTNEQAALGIRWLEPAPIQTDLLAAINLYREFFFLVAQSFELDQAKSPGKQVIAYKAIAALLERAATMMRGKIRHYYRLIRERGRMHSSHVMNFYTEERWISWEENGEEQVEPIRGTDMIVPIKISVVVGSTMPVSRVQEREEAIELFKLRAIDNDELLKKLDWLDRQQILKRMKAGPIGEMLDRLKAVLPPEILQSVAQIAQMESKDFQKAVEQGKIKPIIPPQQTEPTPEQIAQQLELAEKQAEIQEKQAEIQETVAKVRKLHAEQQLILEKAATERMQQQVAAAGVAFDSEKIKLERAEVAAAIKAKAKDQDLDLLGKAVDLVKSSDKRGTAPFKERGLKSNNQEVLR